MEKKILFGTAMIILNLCFPNLIFAETIILKSGNKIEEKIIEKTDKYIRVEYNGFFITYSLDDIESIDGRKIGNSPTLANNFAEFKVIAKQNKDFLKDKNNNCVIHYKTGNEEECNITRRIKNEIVYKIASGIEVHSAGNTKDIDYIETTVPCIFTNTYVNHKYGIVLQGPKDWVMVIPEGYYKEVLQWAKGQLVYFHKHPIEEMRLAGKVDSFISLVVDDNPPGIKTALDYAYQRMKIFNKARPDFRVIDPVEVDLIDRKWVKLEMESRDDNVRQINYFLLQNNRIYWISFGATLQDFEIDISIFKDVINSLELKTE